MPDARAQKIIDQIIARATDVSIVSDVALNDEQLQALYSLNEYCVHQLLTNPEVARDPRKLIYMTNQEMKTALVAICLAGNLINPMRKRREDLQFFVDNITVSVEEGNVKRICFGKISPYDVQDAIYYDIVEDWKIYRDKEGQGIITLMDDKTNLVRLPGYKMGGNPLYEFARFHRKYTEKERKKEERARDEAQIAFRNEMARTIAHQVTQQQLLEGKNPMELMELLFAPTGRKSQEKIKKIAGQSKKVDKEIEQNIMLMLEDKSGEE